MTGPVLPEWFAADAWVPPPRFAAEANVTRLLQRERLPSYAALLARAAAHPEWFYPAAFEDLGLEWLTPWERLVDESKGVAWADWFVGATTNLVTLCLGRWPAAATALIWEGDDGARRTLSAGQLRSAVGQAAAGLSRLGVARGDVVALYLPMLPEAVISLLAAAQLGAIAQPSFSGYGVDALAERLRLGGARVVITADVMLRRGRRVPLLPVAAEAARRSGCVEVLVTVERTGARRPASSLRSLTWTELLDGGGSRPPEAFEAGTPFLLAFTSGSSGRPKGVVHTHGGLPYRFAIELAYCLDLRAGDRICWMTDMGWIMGPLSSLPPLALGATVVIFEGVPDHPEPDRLWSTVERHGVTHLGLSPTVARVLAACGDHWVDRRALSSLRVLASTGEPWTLPAWRWLHRHVGRGERPIINITGGAEIGGTILAGSPIIPTQAGRFAGPGPGMAVDVFGVDGAPLCGSEGELVIARSWPSMTRGFWQEPERYLETYWSRWPNVWCHGDRAIRHADGSWDLLGRSDDVIKVAGKRLGPAELESLATDVPGVVAAAAVGVPDVRLGEQAVMVVQTSESPDAWDAVRTLVKRRLDEALGRAFRVRVLVAAALPMTRSGKVHRRAVRAWLQGTDPGDLSTLENPEAEAEVCAAAVALRHADP